MGQQMRVTDPLPAGFGDGWMSANARDEIRIAVLLAGFDRDELLRRVALAANGDRSVNCATVERVLDEMSAEVSR